jgi:hypothetical protein
VPLSSLWTNTIVDPSGIHAGIALKPGRNRVSAETFAPSGSMTKMSVLPLFRRPENAIVLPSGDHDGSLAPSRSSSTLEPSEPITRIFSARMNAMFPLSPGKTGSPSAPRTGSRRA